MLKRLLPVLLALAPVVGHAASAQQPARSAVVHSGPVRGRVVDAATDAPLPGAHIFFSTTTRGTAADAEGHFSFKNVPVGTQRLHASMLGYAPQTLDTLLHAGRPYRLHIALEPTVLEAGAVSVAARRSGDWKTQGDDDWEDLLAKFERLFVGETPGAEHVTLVNPEALAFDPNWWGNLKADAGAPLVFENRALGYRVRYHLKAFEGSHARLRWDGEPLFERLTPADSAEAARWEANRRRAFHGSLRHFLLALLGDSLGEAGYVVRREDVSRRAFGPARRGARRPARPEHLLSEPSAAARDTLRAGTRLLDFRGRLHITYTREPEAPAFARWQRARRAPRDGQHSYVELDGDPVTLDPAGEIVEPYGATLFGYFAFERLAVLLPKEYRP